MKMLAGVALASLLALSIVPATHADEFDQATKLTFSAPVRVPGQVLPAGTYWFVIANRGKNPIVVQVYNADRTAVIRTFLTASAERQEATDKTVLAFATPDTSANPDADVPALTKWFYPGRDIGNEFIYSNQQERQFQHEAQVTVPVGGDHAVAVGD
ncbi:MAG TPA: hypothetical protein VHX49_09990 [Candidatus Acidoferrales bacterium]|jgi:hypothetical protein|nr:hypothetical protein [Candidatus Acidoferrales bacterium]